ncbi:hypothetical protein ACFLS5_02075 [Candidatus Bipolaricaulota bacterium]
MFCSLSRALFISAVVVQAVAFSTVAGDYLGQELPGLDAVPFAPEILEHYSFGGTFNLDLTEFFYTEQIRFGESSQTIGMAYSAGKWVSIGHPNFLNLEAAMELHIDPAGERVYFTAIAGSGRWKAYYADRTENGWSLPKLLPGPINSNAYLPMYITSTTDGVLYWTQLASDGDFIVRTPRDGDGYGALERIPFDLNEAGKCAHPFIAPDESYLIFDAQVNEGPTPSDLYVTFRHPDDTWTPAQSLDSLNTSEGELAASVSPDGSVLFFARGLKIHWVSTAVLDPYRP